MYADLLKAAVELEDPTSALPTVELVREVARPLGPGGEARGRTDVATAVADQLRYDARLVQLCRRVGIDVDLAAFGRPTVERGRLRAALAELGVLPAGDVLPTGTAAG